MNHIDMRYGATDDIFRLIILSLYYHNNWVLIMHRIHSIWVCFYN